MKCVGYSKKKSYLCFKDEVPLKEQNDRIRDYAKEHGLKIERFYEDKSNDPDSDHAFQKLREDGMNRAFDVVILDSMYRCGKNIGFARQLMLYTFYPMGIHFIVLEDGINTAAMTKEEVEKYFADLRYSVAGYCGNVSKYKNLVKNNQIDFMKERYGYLLNEDRTKMLIDEEAAEIIRFIFNKLDSGSKQAQIARYMNENGIETPAEHLHRVGISRPKPRYSNWTKSAVARIQHCKFYIGAEDTQMGGTVYYPRIIEPEQFERVESLIVGRTKGLTLGKRISNLFKDRIYYGDTGEKLYCRARVEDGKSIVIFHLKNKKVPVIEYEKVLSQVKPVLLEEQKLAGLALDGFDDNRRKEFENRLEDEYRERAKTLYTRSLKAQEGNVELYLAFEKGEISKEKYDAEHEIIMSRQREVNDRFHEMMEELFYKKSILGEKNPWARRFLKFDLSGEIEKRAIYELTKRILIFSDGKVLVELNEEGKDSFPADYLKEVSEDGKKEQKKECDRGTGKC